MQLPSRDGGIARLFGLARDWRVPASCRKQHADVVGSRVRTLSLAIAVLVLAWVPIDAVGLEHVEFVRILPLRLGLAASLLVLVRLRSRLGPDAATAVLVWLQAFAFAGMELCLEPMHGNPLRVGYGLFSFVVAAQLAILPLSWRCLLLALPAGVVVALAPVAFGIHPVDAGIWNDLWLLGLIMIVCGSASHAQLRLLVDLLGARRDASHDPLTGLANRRSAEQRLDAERSRSLRAGEPLSVLMIDLDHFKRINDGWGHACGDRVLAATAQVLRDELRGADLAVRYGGEEFLAILPGTDIDRAMDVAERIRVRIEAMRVQEGETDIAMTASIGAATLEGDEAAAELVARADAALYRAKGGGRNRCVSTQGAGAALAESAAVER